MCIETIRCCVLLISMTHKTLIMSTCNKRSIICCCRWYTVVPPYKTTPSSAMKKGLVRRGDNIAVFYYLSLSEIWQYKRWDEPYKRSVLWWGWSPLREALLYPLSSIFRLSVLPYQEQSGLPLTIGYTRGQLLIWTLRTLTTIELFYKGR